MPPDETQQSPELPQMLPLESSNLQEAGYDPKSGALFVRFKGGGLYRYPDVPVGELESLLNAPSAGKHFHGAIKSRFQGERVG